MMVALPVLTSTNPGRRNLRAWRRSSAFWLSFVLLGTCGCAETPSAKPPAQAKTGEKPRQQERHPPESPSEKLLYSGRYEEVLQAKGPQDSIFAVRALRALGRLDEALVRLEEALKDNEKQTASMMLLKGEILRELGRTETAAEVLVPLTQKVEADELSKADQQMRFAIAGRAAHLLRQPETANAFFNLAEQMGDAPRELLLWRAELFIEKHDTNQADEIVEEALKRFPEHPEVLYLHAEFVLEQSLDFAAAEKLAQDLLKKNPRHSGAYTLLAGIALRDLDFDTAERNIAEGLRTNPRELHLLSMRAATRFLAEDPQGFEQNIDQVLALSPGYSEIFRIVAEYAEWEHRYPDIEKLMRRAARIDREDGRVRALLGLTLVRSASDAAGVVELNRAYELDPYDVRVINTLKLYEENIPELYVAHEEGPFQFRFPQAEAELLKRYVPRLLDEAHGRMVARYSYTPTAPIGIEIYSAREEFAVRTSGLPRTPIQGVCFGRKLATMSPMGSPGNLGMTLWHELAHVFHLGLSQNRTPRWLTEGMAEWETAVRDVGWSRELDLELIQALRADTLPPLESMSRAFTHARHMRDVATAYYASGLLLDWIVESRGQASAVQLLNQLGKKRLPQDVLVEVLGANMKVLDAQFRAWLGKHLARFDGQFTSQSARESSSELAPLLKKDPTSSHLRLALGLALLSEGDLKQAEKIFLALSDEAFNAQATFALARIAIATQDKKKAQSLIEDMTDEGVDGYELRMVLARLYFADEKVSEAEKQLRAAAKLDPEAEEPWSLLASLYLKTENRTAELEVVTKWARLSEHDSLVHRRLIELLIEEERFKEAALAADLALWTDLAGAETHRLAGLAYSRNDDLKRAEFEWESALLTPLNPESEARLQATWLEELNRRGLTARAEAARAKLEKGRAARLKKSVAPVL